MRGGSAATAREEWAKPLPGHLQVSEDPGATGALRRAEPGQPDGARHSQDCFALLRNGGGGVTDRPTALLLRERSGDGVSRTPAAFPGQLRCRPAPLPEAAWGALRVFAGSAFAHPSLASHGPVRGQGHSSEQSCSENCGFLQAVPLWGGPVEGVVCTRVFTPSSGNWPGGGGSAKLDPRRCVVCTRCFEVRA